MSHRVYTFGLHLDFLHQHLAAIKYGFCFTPALLQLSTDFIQHIHSHHLIGNMEKLLLMRHKHILLPTCLQFNFLPNERVYSN